MQIKKKLKRNTWAYISAPDGTSTFSTEYAAERNDITRFRITQHFQQQN
jgi:hypothetical protein